MNNDVCFDEKNTKCSDEKEEFEDCNDYNSISNHETSFIMNKNTSAFDLYKGLIFMLLSCIFKSLYSLLCKLLMHQKEELSSFQLLTYKAYVLFTIMVFLTVYKPKIVAELNPKMLKNILIRSVLCVISMSLIIFALKFLHISDVYAVYYIYPAIIIFLSGIFFNEKFVPIDYFCLISCFVGVIFVIKPEFLFAQDSSMKIKGVGFFFFLVVLTALIKSIEDMLIKNSGNEVHPLVFPLFYALAGVVLYPIPMIVNNGIKPPSMDSFEVALIVMIAVCNLFYQVFLALAMQSESAGRVSMVNYFQVVFVYVSDLVIFRKPLMFSDILGICLILGFNLYNGVQKALKRMRNLSKLKLNI